MTPAPAAASAPGGSFGDRERDLVIAAGEDARVRSGYWMESMGPQDRPQRYPRIQIVVHAMLKDGGPAGMLRVYYVPRGLLGLEMPGQFPRLTSPFSAASLPLANYAFWLGNPGDTTRRSDVHVLDVSASSRPKPDTIELVVRPQ